MLGATYLHLGTRPPPAWPATEPFEAAPSGGRARHAVLAAALIAVALIVAATLVTNLACGMLASETAVPSVS